MSLGLVRVINRKMVFIGFRKIVCLRDFIVVLGRRIERDFLFLVKNV